MPGLSTEKAAEFSRRFGGNRIYIVNWSSLVAIYRPTKVRLMREQGYTIPEISQVMQVSEVQVQNLIRLQRLQGIRVRSKADCKRRRMVHVKINRAKVIELYRNTGDHEKAAAEVGTSPYIARCIIESDTGEKVR